jgi:hypothetical protein
MSDDLTRACLAVGNLAGNHERLRAAVKALLARCEATEGQAFYDRVKPEWEAVKAAIEN